MSDLMRQIEVEKLEIVSWDNESRSPFSVFSVQFRCKCGGNNGLELPFSYTEELAIMGMSLIAHLLN